MDIKVVFFDIDGTLVSFNTHCVPESTLRDVAALRRKGIKVYIATGRPAAFVDNLGELEYDGMITVTGAHCFTAEGRVIAHTPVPEADVRRVVKHVESEPTGAYPVIFVCPGKEAFINCLTDDVREVCSQLNLPLPPVRPAAEALGSEVLQMISFFREEREADYMNRLMPGCTSMRWHPYFTDVIASGVSKQAGIDAVLAYEGIAVEDTMAFGDGGNDISMLSHVGIGVAMGNALPEVRQAADYVTDTVDNAGISKALRHFDLL
ncbi:MAG: Cof-type HAD-IIB family hydrolase [Clostridium sp.]|nr:Cof-type HAD-IIB family hydrolase [Clostridium sp.]